MGFEWIRVWFVTRKSRTLTCHPTCLPTQKRNLTCTVAYVNNFYETSYNDDRR